jgi:hypothetical protein
MLNLENSVTPEEKVAIEKNWVEPVQILFGINVIYKHFREIFPDDFLSKIVADSGNIWKIDQEKLRERYSKEKFPSFVDACRQYLSDLENQVLYHFTN